MQPNEPAERRVRYKDLMLQPLRIPAGWRVVFNNFYEVRPTDMIAVEGLPRESKWALFDEDIIYLKHEVFDVGVDLGWYPSCDPDGAFLLQVVRSENWESPLETFESTDLDAVLVQLEKWLNAGASGAFGQGAGPRQKTSNKGTGPGRLKKSESK